MAKKQNPASEEGKEGLLARIARFGAYVEDSRGELRKVSWPSLRETRSATFVVLGFVAVMALLLGLVDFGLSGLIKFILS
jgi:preprotein translocase subunit SecE